MNNLKVEAKEAVFHSATAGTTAIAAGDVVLLNQGKLVTVAHAAIAASASGTVVSKGRFALAKDTTLTISVGDSLFWDVANTQLSTEPLGPFAGRCAVAALSADTTVEIDLNDYPLGAAAEGSDLIVFEDDFIGLDGALLKETGSLGIWEDVDVAGASVAPVSNENGGAMKLDIEATSEAQDAVLYLGDQLNFDIDKLQYMEMRVKIVTPGTGTVFVWGLAGNHNLDKDTIAQNAWFRVDAALAVDVESDDGTNNNDNKTTAITLTTDVYAWFKIDISDPASVKFYIRTEGATTYTQVAAATTFDMSNYTAGLQPYFSGDKATGTGTGSLTIDKVKLVGER